MDCAFLVASASSAFCARAAFLALSFSALASASTERVESFAVTAPSVVGTRWECGRLACEMSGGRAARKGVENRS